MRARPALLSLSLLAAFIIGPSHHVFADGTFEGRHMSCQQWFRTPLEAKVFYVNGVSDGLSLALSMTDVVMSKYPDYDRRLLAATRALIEGAFYPPEGTRVGAVILEMDVICEQEARSDSPPDTRNLFARAVQAMSKRLRGKP